MPNSSISGSGNAIHFGGLRLRVVGSGNLEVSIATLEDVIVKTNSPIVLAEPNRIEPYRILNFTTQRASIKLQTVNENEWFKINQLVVYARPVFQNYPQ